MKKNRAFDNALPTIIITTPRGSKLPLGPTDGEWSSYKISLKTEIIPS